MFNGKGGFVVKDYFGIVIVGRVGDVIVVIYVKLEGFLIVSLGIDLYVVSLFDF